jgi:hypothetical protein
VLCMPGLASSPLRFRPAGGKALDNSDQLPTRGPLGAGKCLLAGGLVETPPVSGPKFRSAGRRPFQNFRNFGPPALKFRPVDELASPGVCPHLQYRCCQHCLLTHLWGGESLLQLQARYHHSLAHRRSSYTRPRP